jgi:DNA polymerase-3 subunit gamma/tau
MTQVETYVPLYRKYRPQSFADLVGQEAIAQTLGNALNLNKVAHAYLFCGPRGTGKTSTARIFAKSLNCETGPTMTPCQTCPSCEGITQGNALDVIEFDAASNNGVEDARELIESCQFAPMAGRFKIYIIDEVHMLSTAAFNALLKTLEEPPPNVIFIFATTEAHKVLPTIISRCQRFDFNRITNQDIVQRLQAIAGWEQIQILPDAVELIARHARGGLRDAVGLLDQVAVLGRIQPDTPITQKDLATLIGTLEEDLLLQVVDHIGQRRSAELLSLLTDVIHRGVEPSQLSKDLIQHFRNLLVAKAAGPPADAKALGFSPEFYQALSQQTQQFAPEELPQILTQLSATDRQIRNTQQPQLWLEIGLISLAYRQDIALVQDLAQRVQQLEERLQGGVPMTAAAPVPASRPANLPPPQPPAQSFAAAPQPLPVMPPPPTPAAATTPPPPATLPVQPAASISGGGASSWEDICAKVASPPTKALLKQHFFLLRVEGTEVVVGSSSEPNLNVIKRPDRFIHLQKAVDAYFGQPMKLQAILEKQVPAAAAMAPTPLPPAPAQPPPPPPPPPPPAAPVAAPPIEEAPPLLEEAPPLEEMPPLEDSPPEPLAEGRPPHQDTMSPPTAMTPPLPSPSDAEAENPEELAEAKKFTMSLLQGKILE